MKFTLFSIIILYLLNSCHTSSLSLNKDKVITFTLPEKTFYQSDYLSYYAEKDKEYLVSLNSRNHTIDFYDFNTMQIAWRTPFNKDPEVLSGASGFYISTIDSSFSNGLNAFYVGSPDSIYLSLKYSNQVVLINKEGALLNRWVLNDPVSFYTDYWLSASAGDWMEIVNNQLYTAHAPRVNDYTQIPDTKPVLIYNLQERKVIANPGAYPESYHQGVWWHLVGMTANKAVNKKGEVLISFPVEHALFLYNNDSLIQTTATESRYLKKYEFPSFDNEQRSNTAYKVKYVSTLGYYYSLIYDPFRNIYYRVVLHPQDYRNADNTVNMDADRSWSVMILDEDLNVLSETYFPSKKYLYYNLIVTKAGLLISNNHELNPDLNSGKFSFTLFKPGK